MNHAIMPLKSHKFTQLFPLYSRKYPLIESATAQFSCHLKTLRPTSNNSHTHIGCDVIEALGNHIVWSQVGLHENIQQSFDQVLTIHMAIVVYGADTRIRNAWLPLISAAGRLGSWINVRYFRLTNIDPDTTGQINYFMPCMLTTMYLLMSRRKVSLTTRTASIGPPEVAH